MDHIASPRSPEVELESALPRVRWRIAVAVLVGLLAVHWALAVLFYPVDTYDVIALPQRLFDFFGLGAVFAQGVLLAIASVLAPVRLVVRLPVTLALVVLFTYAAAIGNLRLDVQALVESSILLMLYFLFLPPTAAVCQLRRWRIVPRPQHSGNLSGRQFSLFGVLALITLASLVLAGGRWVASFGVWPSSISAWVSIIRGIGPEITAVACGCLPVLACTALVLAPRWRVTVLVGCMLSMPAGIAILFAGLAIAGAPTPGPAHTAALTAMMLGVYASALASLLVVRRCGFRLVREPKGGNAGSEQPTEAAA